MKLSSVRKHLKKGPVALDWVDAIARFDYNEDGPPGCINRSYGEIVEIRNNFVVLAAEVEGVIPSGQGARSITEIPIVLVLKITQLKEGEVNV